jgi:hypothetical protein
MRLQVKHRALDGAAAEKGSELPRARRLGGLRRHLAGLAAVGGLAVLTACASPWDPLTARFGSSETLPADAERPAAVKLTAASGGGAFIYKGDILYSLDDRGLLLRFEGVRLARGTVRVPTPEIASCSRTSLPSRKYSNLWVRDADVEIAIEVEDDHVIRWCEARHIPVVDAAQRMRSPS